MAVMEAFRGNKFSRIFVNPRNASKAAIRESLFPRNASKPAIPASLFPQNALKQSRSKYAQNPKFYTPSLPLYAVVRF